MENAFGIRQSFLFRHWAETEYTKEGKIRLRFNFDEIKTGSEGDQASFISLFHETMRLEDKKAFCMTLAVLSYQRQESYKLFPVLDTLQRVDPYMFSFMKGLLLTEAPSLPTPPPSQQYLAKTPNTTNAVPPPMYPGSETPQYPTLKMMEKMFGPRETTGIPAAFTKYATTIPGCAIPLEDDGLNESHPSLETINLDKEGE